jgi:hypothetical protein
VPHVALHGLPHFRGIRQIANRPGPGSHALLRSQDRALWQALAIARDRAGRGDPQPIAVADDVADGVAERAQTERLADDERVHRDREDQRVFSRLLRHLVELVDHHLGELPPAHSKIFLTH